MTAESAPIDLSKGSLPNLADLADEVHRTNRPRLLRRADEDIAVITPVRKKVALSPFKKKSPEDIEAFLSTAGGWKDLVDTETLRAAVEASRRLPVKPRPEL